MTIPQLSDWVGTHVPDFRHTQISNHARYLGVEIGPGAEDHRWTKARNKFVGVCVGIRSSSQCQVQRLVSFKIFALFVLTFVGSVAEPDTATIATENMALQRSRLGLFTRCLQPCCGGEILAAQKKLMVSSSRARPPAFVLLPVLMCSISGHGAHSFAKDHDGRTFGSRARSWDDLYLHFSTAHFCRYRFSDCQRLG